MLEKDPVYVTTTRPRIREYRGGITYTLSHRLDPDTREWWKQFNTDMDFFTFPKMKSKGVDYLDQLLDAIRDRNGEVIPNLLEEIGKYRIPNWEEKSVAVKWGDRAIQLPTDWGPQDSDKKRIKRMMTTRANGRVLEAMCGFRSYFGAGKNISEVVALDFCRESLELYDYPKRARILYDLERVSRGERMDFFADSSFQTIGVTFGVTYLSNPELVYREFHRILAPKGKAFIVGGDGCGYHDLEMEDFDQNLAANRLDGVGFETKIRELSVKEKWKNEKYYLVEATKN